MFGKKQRIIAEQQKQIEALNAEIARLNEEKQAFLARVAEIERRESGIGRAISEATATADSLIESAQRKAGAMLEQTQSDCDAAKRDAENMVDDAYRNARDIVKEAEATGQQRLDEVDTQINQYAALLNTYDKLVQEQMLHAQENLKRLYELSKALHDTVPKILSPDGTLRMPEPAQTPEEQPIEPEPVEEAQEQPIEPEQPEAPEESDEPVEDSGEGTPLMTDEEFDFETHPFRFEPQNAEPENEHLWTVGEVTADDKSNQDTHVDAIIEDILRASREQNRE